MLGQFGEKKFQILVGVETVGLGRLDDAVKHCAGFCPREISVNLWLKLFLQMGI